MPIPGGWELILILVVLVLLFGAKKLPDMARSIGQSARVFKGEMKGLKEDGGAKDAATDTTDATDSTDTPQTAKPAPLPPAAAAQPETAPAPKSEPAPHAQQEPSGAAGQSTHTTGR